MAYCVDYAEDGPVIGIEVFYLSMGVDTGDLPEQARVEQLLERHKFKVLT